MPRLAALLLSLVCSTASAQSRFPVAAAPGGTDVTPAIQAAIDAAAKAGGGTVVIPSSPEPYTLRGTVRITSSNITLEGPGATLFRPDNAGTGPGHELIVVHGAEDRPILNVTIRGLTLDANYFNQPEAYRPRAIEIIYTEGARLSDLTIIRPYVGIDFGRGSVDGEVRRTTIVNYEEDAFDAGGDADEFSGSTCRDIRFIDVTARDAPRSRGNAFEIEDGAHDVLVRTAVVENTSGDGFGIRNHNEKGQQIHSRNIEVRGVRMEGVAGNGIYVRCGPAEKAAMNSYHDVRLIDVFTDAPVLVHGPIEGFRMEGGRYGPIYVGYRTPTEPDPVREAEIVDVVTPSLKVLAR